MLYYCQPDGGQWNVLVTKHWQGIIDGTEFAIISGIKLVGYKTKDHGREANLTPIEWLHTEIQP